MSAIPRPPCPRDVPCTPSGLHESTNPPVRPVARAEMGPGDPSPGRRSRREGRLPHLACGRLEVAEIDPYPPRWRPRPRRTYLHRCPCCHVTRFDPSLKAWSCPRCAETGDDVAMEVVVMYLD